MQEGGQIGETDNPQFTTLTYAIKDYAGILPISRTLLSDNDANLLSYVVQWLGRKVRVTRNVAIIEQFNALEKSLIEDLYDIKRILNVTLDPAIRETSNIIVNQDSFNWLDKLKDVDGKYVLQPDPTNATILRLFGRHEIAVISNRFLKTTGNKAPIIIGDTKEVCVLFLREQIEFLSTEIGGDAFKRNMLDLRTIMRHDARVWDKDAAIYGQLDITPVV